MAGAFVKWEFESHQLHELYKLYELYEPNELFPAVVFLAR